MAAQPARRRPVRAADLLESVFGPDPGLIRLRTAARATFSAALAPGAVWVLLGAGSGDMRVAGPIGIGMMTGLFANMVVRDPTPLRQLESLVLLLFPPLIGVALSSVLADRVWLSDLCFILVVMVAALAPMAGPRGFGLGMLGFVGYFIGVILKPPLSAMPHLSMAVSIGVGSAAIARFVVLRDHPEQTLRQVKRHLARRVDRILAQADALLADDRLPRAEAREHRAHYEIGRLNDALMVAHDQLDAVEARDIDANARLSDCFFRLELTAERLIRLAAMQPARPDTSAARERIARLRRAIAGRRVEPPERPGGPEREDRLLATLDELQAALAGMLTLEPWHARESRA